MYDSMIQMSSFETIRSQLPEPSTWKVDNITGRHVFVRVHDQTKAVMIPSDVSTGAWSWKIVNFDMSKMLCAGRIAETASYAAECAISAQRDIERNRIFNDNSTAEQVHIMSSQLPDRESWKRLYDNVGPFTYGDVYVRVHDQTTAIVSIKSCEGLWQWRIVKTDLSCDVIHDTIQTAGRALSLHAAAACAMRAQMRLQIDHKTGSSVEQPAEMYKKEKPEEDQDMTTATPTHSTRPVQHRDEDHDVFGSTKQLICDSTKLATGLVVAKQVNDAAVNLLSAALVKLGVPASLLEMPAVQTTIHLLAPVVVLQLTHMIPELRDHSSTIERGCTLAMSVEMTQLVGPLVGQLKEQIGALISAASQVDSTNVKLI
jgi:hypothetical protein